MTQCPNCGAQVADGQNFCQSCGTTVTSAMPAAVGAPAVDDTMAMAATPPPPPPPPPGDPSTWMSTPPPPPDATVAMPVGAYEPPLAPPLPPMAATTSYEYQPAPVAAAPRSGNGKFFVALVAAILLFLLLLGSVFVNMGTRDKLSKRNKQLAVATKALNDTKSDLASTKGQLDDKNKQLDTTKKQLTQAQADLTSAKGSLTQAQSQLDLQAGQLDTLKQCLTGVATALGAFADGNNQGVLDALNPVQDVCNKADAIINNQ